MNCTVSANYYLFRHVKLLLYKNYNGLLPRPSILTFSRGKIVFSKVAQNDVRSLKKIYYTFFTGGAGGLSVTVIYCDPEYREEGAAEFCQEKGWKYRDYWDMQGCEDECVIVMDCLYPESISRPHNLLVVVTTPEHQ